MRTWLRLDLLGDVILPRDSATVGAPLSLGHIPGSQLLGAAASRIYGQLGGDEQWTVFHSGRVRFCDGLPLSGGLATVPFPTCMHHDKLNPAVEERSRVLIRSSLRNAGREELTQGIQWKALRGGFLDAAGRRHRPRRASALRTSMAGEHAREGFLHSIDAIARGQSFLASVDRDEDVDPKLVERVVAALLGEIHVGRSRSAEFGRVRVSRAHDVESAGMQSLLRRADPTGGFQVLLLSDLALRDPETLGPVLRPTGDRLGIPEARVVLGKSFLRTRSYSPFHGIRKRPDLERQVIEGGSVLWVEGVSAEAFSEASVSGLGEHRQEGLGQVAVDPACLVEASWETVPTSHATLPEPSDPEGLLRWLRDRAEASKVRARLFEDVGVWSDGMGPFRISRSQWGVIRDIAARTSADDLLRELSELVTKEDGVTGVIWSRRRGEDTAGGTLVRCIEGVKPQHRGSALRFLADEMTRRSREKEDRDAAR